MKSSTNCWDRTLNYNGQHPCNLTPIGHEPPSKDKLAINYNNIFREMERKKILEKKKKKKEGNRIRKKISQR